VTVLWNIIIKNREQKTCVLIDVAISGDRNVIQKETKNKLKYESLCIEIERKWNMECLTIPVVTGTTEIVTKGLKKNLKAIPGKHSMDSLQKTAVLGTSHITLKILQSET
jgi:hypothetical protein